MINGSSTVSDLDYRTCDLREMVADIRDSIGWTRMMHYLEGESTDRFLREGAERAWKQARVARETARLDRWLWEGELARLGQKPPPDCQGACLVCPKCRLGATT